MPHNRIVRLLLLIATTLIVAVPVQAQRPDGAINNRPQSYRDRDDRDERHRTLEAKPNVSSKSAKPMDRAAPLTAVKPISPPSKAEQLQQQMNEQRRLQYGQQAGADAGNFRCSAFPVCDRTFGSYGSCRGVEQFYSAKSWRDARQQIARECASANTPDPCNCAAQCSRVAQCGPI
jgi:hypothetical protein